MNDEERASGRLAVLAGAASLALLALKLHVARSVGYGDSEALYASYALHPQPAYLDHPGLIGSLMRLLGGGVAPSPAIAHLASAVLGTLVPWAGALAARAAGATPLGSLRTCLALLFVPELAIGLFGLTPDLLLALLWILALGLALVALRSPPSSFRALGASLGAGALIGLGCLAKLSAGLLGLALLAVLFTRAERARWKTLAPWAGIAVAAVLVAPVVVWEVRNGFPMAVHRLISTQQGSGLSLRNLGALVGGQLAYLTPPFLFAAGLLGWDLWKNRRADSSARLLLLASVVPAVPLVVLCLWSRGAEPHWLAPAYLALSVYLGRSPVVGPKLARASVVTGAFVIALGWAWVTTSLPMKLLGKHYRPRYDLANDMHAWAPGRRMLERAIAQATIESRELPVIVGPHWIVCAQIEAALGPRVGVGCNSPQRDDFDRWFPRESWMSARSVLYVHDSRFTLRPERELPGRRVRGITSVEVRRGGEVVRTIWATHLEKDIDVGLSSEPGLRSAPPP